VRLQESEKEECGKDSEINESLEDYAMVVN
jgi:hypothetical protein